MNYGVKKNIRVFYSWPSESWLSGFISDVGSWVKKAIDKTDKFWESINLSVTALKAIASAKISSNPKVKLAYDILRTTNAITYDPLELASRFQERDWWKWAKAILDALNAAEKWEIQIVTFEWWSYQSINFRKYEGYIQKNPEKIDSTLIDGLVEIYKWSWDKNSFTENTWSNIAAYLVSIWWNKNKAINNSSKEFLTELYKKINTKYTEELNKILEPVIIKLGKDSPELKKLLKENNIFWNNWNIDFDQMVIKFKIKDLKDFDLLVKNKVAEIKKESDELLKSWNDQLKTLKANKLIASSIGIIPDITIAWKPKNLDRKNIDTWNLDEINAAIPNISSKLQSLESSLIREIDSNKIDKIWKQKILLSDILEALTKKKLWFEKSKQAWSLEISRLDAVKESKKNPKLTLTDVTAILSTNESRKRQNVAWEISLSRVELTDSLQASKKISFETAQKLYLELVNKTILTNDEEIKKREYLAIIEAHKNIARVQKNAEKNLGKEEAREIFTQTNRFISWNPNETYDFKALEKIAILTDPESTPGQRAFARLEPGKTVSMQKLMEWEMQSSIVSSPEIASMNVTMNAAGWYDIPLLREVNLSKPQVQEYMTNIALYADLWLSQLIPHIPLITAELRNKWINTSIDGSTNTMEQQQVLKEIYGLLFWKKIETNSLGDVERAFVSSAWNPTSMKNAMQYTLKVHHLIGESGQTIAADTLQKWIRWTQESTPNKTDLLANIQ
jgi:hypothetical protein